MHLPYALQLAHGWTRIGLQFAAFKIAVFLPLLVFAASLYGAVGGAAVGVLLNASYLALGVPLSLRRLLRGRENGRTRLALSDLVTVVMRHDGAFAVEQQRIG